MLKNVIRTQYEKQIPYLATKFEIEFNESNYNKKGKIELDLLLKILVRKLLLNIAFVSDTTKIETVKSSEIGKAFHIINQDHKNLK